MKKINLYMMMLPILVAGVLLFSLNSCNNEDVTRVTIHIERNDLALKAQPQKRFIDRVLEFFSTRAEAVTPPSWNSEKTGELELTVSGNLFEDMIYFVPASSTSYTVTIPSSNNVTFTLTATYSGVKNWGGHTTDDVLPGEKEISLTMIPMMDIMLEELTGSIGVTWDISGVPSSVTGYNVYRSSTENGSYSFIGTTGTTYYTDSGLPTGETYFYRVSAVGTYGEGVMCDPVAGTVY